MTAKRRMLLLCVLLLTLRPAPGGAQYDSDKHVRERVKTLATDRDAKDRADAARFLGGFDQPEAVAALAKALSDPDASVREAAASSLWKTGKAASAAKPELQKALDDPVAAVVARAAGALSSMGATDQELAGAWRRALAGAADGSTSFLAARGLIGVDPPAKLAPPILAYLGRNAEAAARPASGRSSLDDTKNAEAGAKALGGLLKEGAAPLLPLLKESVETYPNSGRYVLDTLGALKNLPPGSVELALSFTGSPAARTRSAAISLAGKVTSEREAARWIPEAIRLLGDPDESVRSEACRALAGAKGLAHGAAPELARLLSKDSSAAVRKRAAAALGAIGDATNPIPPAAKAAVASEAKGALAGAMRSKEKDVAVEAVAAYNVLQLDSAEIVATLAGAAVSGADTSARERALLCLRNRQGQAKGIVGTIRPLTGSSEKAIADDARTAVEWIERGGAGTPAAVAAGGAAVPAPVSSGASPAAAPAAPPGGEERGLAALRERKLEFSETGFFRALTAADAGAIRAYLDAGMSAKLGFASSEWPVPAHGPLLRRNGVRRAGERPRDRRPAPRAGRGREPARRERTPR